MYSHFCCTFLHFHYKTAIRNILEEFSQILLILFDGRGQNELFLGQTLLPL